MRTQARPPSPWVPVGPIAAGSLATPKARFWRHLPENRLTKCQTNHCFLTFSEYIAPQRVRCARSFWPGFLFGEMRPIEFQVLERDPEKWIPVFRRDRASTFARPEEEP